MHLSVAVWESNICRHKEHFVRPTSRLSLNASNFSFESFLRGLAVLTLVPI